MKIKKIKITNVKSFRSLVELDFDDKLNILIGPNGGGKSNLLSILTIVLNHFFYKSFQPKYKSDSEQNTIELIEERQAFQNIDLMLEKHFNDPSDSEIELTLESDESDYENMSILAEKWEVIEARFNKYGANYIIDRPEGWPELFRNKKIMTFCIRNNCLEGFSPDTAEYSYLKYLNNYHKLRWFTDDQDDIELYSPLIFFPPSRSLNGNFIVDQNSLKSVDYFNQLNSISDYQSKSANVSLVNLAVTHFGRKKRQYENKAAYTAGLVADQLFSDDDEVKLLDKYLIKIGYGWKIKEDKQQLKYQFLLTKSGESFDISKASSGEQEILNFLLGIFSLNVRGGVVFIDEPEIHLHPKWQSLLLEIFIDISSNKNNQFIFSTHSPTFVSPNTYNHLVRVYRSNDESRSIVLKEVEPFDQKDILHIINGTNSEKMFFADSVVLVEGITDRLVFNKILDGILSENNSSKIIEVIEVRGKTNLEKFSKFLDSLNIPTFFIADLDFINEVGSSEIKQFFITDEKKIAKDVIKNKKSKDGEALVEELEQAIESQEVTNLKSLWEYIKSFRRQLRPDLDTREKSILEEFIIGKEDDDIFILEEGDIEQYFPSEFSAKDLNNVISLLKDENYTSWKIDANSNYDGLYEIATKIIEKSG
jgi:putative ATP-dependent endonuclease of OLD family